MKIGDLVKDNFYQRTGIITRIEDFQGKGVLYLIAFLDEEGNFRSKEKWLEPVYFKKIS
tara:strand:- start:1160 stop:1336 length:177 start_codon:yes stop_codon:yes gene_type:complete